MPRAVLAQCVCPVAGQPAELPGGIFHRPAPASHTRGTRITIWDIGSYPKSLGTYLVSLLDQLGYRTQFKELSSDPNAPLRFADSRTSAQAALTYTQAPYLSASQMIQVPFACQAFTPNSTKNANLAEFCDPRLDAQIHARAHV